MKTEEWKDDFIDSYVKIGIEKGDQQGAARTKAQDVLKVIDARKLKPTKEQRAMVTADAGLDKLDLWFDGAQWPRPGWNQARSGRRRRGSGHSHPLDPGASCS